MCKEGSLSKRKQSNTKLHVIIPSTGRLKHAKTVFFADRHQSTFIIFWPCLALKSISVEGGNSIIPFETF